MIMAVMIIATTQSSKAGRYTYLGEQQRDAQECNRKAETSSLARKSIRYTGEYKEDDNKTKVHTEDALCLSTVTAAGQVHP